MVLSSIKADIVFCSVVGGVNLNSPLILSSIFEVEISNNPMQENLLLHLNVEVAQLFEFMRKLLHGRPNEVSIQGEAQQPSV